MPTHDHLPSRRRFVCSLALAAPAALACTPLRADDPPAKAEGNDETPPATEVDARMALVLQRYGDRLDEDALERVRTEVEAMTNRAEQLRKFDLDNGDGPMPVFTPYRAPLA